MWTTEQLIAAALEEDIGTGDLTSEYFVPAAERASARIFVKEAGVLAGVEVAAAVFAKVDPELDVQILLRDGARLTAGETVLEVFGRTRPILTAERTALNFIQRLSGVASQTARFMAAIEGTGVRMLDTRKTTPGWRQLEKAAVAAGGGTNHRIGLHDAVMVKDNHLLAESRLSELQAAIDKVRAARPGVRIELEADRREQVEAFLALRGVDWILLDNMTHAELAECVALVRKEAPALKLEASGGVTIETVRGIAETGVDFISSGALTHSARALDFSLELTRVE